MIQSIITATARLDVSLRPAIAETPLVRRPEFDGPKSAVFAKLENTQTTGSFKLRGATAKLQSLVPDQLEAGVVTASTGNHGAAVGHAARLQGTPVEVFVSAEADDRKVAAIRDLGATITTVPGDPVRAEVAARAAAAHTGRVYVPPYNDPVVIAGQGTIACELLRQLQPLDAVVVSVGGGGLISGIAATLQAQGTVRVVGASARHSAAMHHSVAAGEIIETEHLPTLSDGTAGGIEAGSITFEMCRRLVDDWVLVDESEIAAAMRRYMDANEDRIEGSAAVSFAALERLELAGNVAVIVCGGNVAPATLERIGVAADI